MLESATLNVIFDLRIPGICAHLCKPARESFLFPIRKPDDGLLNFGDGAHAGTLPSQAVIVIMHVKWRVTCDEQFKSAKLKF